MSILSLLCSRLSWVHAVLVAFVAFLLLISTFMGDVPQADDPPENLDVFPSDFWWATATASYQIEGASSEGGRGDSVWDEIRRIPGRIKDGSPAALSCEGFRKWKEDVRTLVELGVTHYRFSLSWTRILPSGRSSDVNEEGIRFYSDLIRELKANGIEPIVTLFHADFPLELFHEGSWLNPDSVQWFSDFAALCFERFGDTVSTWVTFNEIPMYAWVGVAAAENLPNFALDIDVAQWNLTLRQVPYVVGHRMLLAHATAFRLYKEKFFATQKGRVGIVSGGRWSEPVSGHESAALRAFAWHFRWLNDPVFGDGNYPREMRERMTDLAEKEGLAEILPTMSEEEKMLIKGSADFIGINYYIVTKVGEFVDDSRHVHSQMEKDGLYDFYADNYERISGDTWLRNTPFGLSHVLRFVRENYDNVPVLISENGCADVLPVDKDSDVLDDVHRIRYIRDHIRAVGGAISEGSNVLGYTVWTLMDNFEWEDGFAVKFGLYHVDFTSAEKTRTPKRSAVFYRNLINKAKAGAAKQEL